MKDDDFWFNLFGYSIILLAVLLTGIQLGIWHGRLLERKEKCDPPVICKGVKGGLECNYGRI